MRIKFRNQSSQENLILCHQNGKRGMKLKLKKRWGLKQNKVNVLLYPIGKLKLFLFVFFFSQERTKKTSLTYLGWVDITADRTDLKDKELSPQHVTMQPLKSLHNETTTNRAVKESMFDRPLYITTADAFWWSYLSHCEELLVNTSVLRITT